MSGIYLSECSSLESISLSNFNTKNFKNMESIFEEFTKLELLDLSNFDKSLVTYLKSMFNLIKTDILDLIIDL